MKAMVLRAPNTPLQLEERERPRPGRGEILIRVAACGVCHGDLMTQAGEFPFVSYPVVPGHEIAGVVEEAGEGVKKLRPGDRVGVSALFSTCGRCRHCTTGFDNLCAHWVWTGMMKDGGYQQFMVAPGDYAASLPESLDFAEAAPVMCAGLTVFSGLKHAGFKPGHKVAVMGLGGLGHFGALYAKAMGGRLAVISSSPEKEAEARSLGAELFIRAPNEALADQLRAWEGGADIILATPPSVEPMSAAFPGLAPDGTMVVLGAGPGQLAVAPMPLIMGRRRLMGSPAGSRRDLQEALDFAAKHRFHPKVKRFPLERANDVLTEMQTGHMSGRAVLMAA